MLTSGYSSRDFRRVFQISQFLRDREACRQTFNLQNACEIVSKRKVRRVGNRSKTDKDGGKGVDSMKTVASVGG